MEADVSDTFQRDVHFLSKKAGYDCLSGCSGHTSTFSRAS